MNDELTDCYNLLGLSPGASSAEAKAAHRDLAKVWHPDRFLHDLRLQQKAEKKLKEINEAYDRLRSGKAKRQTPRSSNHERPAESYTQTVNVGKTHKIHWSLVLAPVVILAVMFLVTTRSLLRRPEPEIPVLEQGPAPAGPTDSLRQQSGSRVSDSTNGLPPGNVRNEARSQRKDSDRASSSLPDDAPLRALPTITVVVDPTTGMIARSGCPVKTSMTYPSGNEPHQYCTSHGAAPTYEASAPGELRVKSAVKRLASPDKWFGGKSPQKQDVKSPSP